MKALKLSSNTDEKKQLKAQCGVLMDVADRIKNSKDWTPLVKQQSENTKQSPSVYNNSRTAAPANTYSTPGNLPFSIISFPSQHTFDVSVYRDNCRQACMPLFGLLDDQSPSLCLKSSNVHADMQRKDISQVGSGEGLELSVSPATAQRAPLLVTSSAPQIQHPLSDTEAPAATAMLAPAASIAPKLASHSHIHRLTEPVSTRKRSRKEDIILLKASVVNGFKCPPWDQSPAPTEFALQNGQELFQ